MSEQVIEFDDLANDTQEEIKIKPRGRRTKTRKTVDDVIQDETPVVELEGNDFKGYKLPNTANALTRNAKVKLEMYLKKSPQFKVLQKQIDLLMTELQQYKDAGNQELVDKTEALIKDLGVKRNKFIKLYKEQNFQKTKAENQQKIKSSPELKTMKERRKQLEEDFKNLNPLSIIGKMKFYRETIDMVNQVNGGDEDFDAIVDFDDMVTENLEDEMSRQDYFNYCNYVGSIIHYDGSEVAQMSLNAILNELKENVSKDELDEIKRDLDTVKMEISTEISRLKGNNDITDIIYDIFDFEDSPEEQPKEMLAASSIPHVKAIAYNNCSKLNMMHHFDDAVAYGLVGLSVAINKWYSLQKLKDSALSFQTFGDTYISNNIKKGLYELSASGGVINKNSLATLIHKRNKKIQAYMELNPELKDVPQEMIESILDGVIDEKPPMSVTEGEFTSVVGGEEGDSADIWANATTDTADADTFAESKINYEELLKSIKNLFKLFKTKTDKETGIKAITETKIFDKFDYKLFKLVYGLEYKKNVDGSGQTIKSNYSQEEIGRIMGDFHAANGDMKWAEKGLDQALVSYRIERLNKKLKYAMEEYPTIRKGFEYLYTYWQSNQESMNLLSNSREEFGLQLDDNTAEQFTEMDNDMDNALSSGKTIEDYYDYNNLLDDEIGNIFN